MRDNTKNRINSVNRLFGQLAAEKKKAVLALCLITLMAFMWIRTLTRRGPESANAAFTAEQADTDGQLEPELKISFTELPKVSGRNDVITRDIFDSDGWQEFAGGEGRKSFGVEEVNIVSNNSDEEVIRKIAENLNLEAIVSSENPLAFINDKVLRIGDKLLVGDGVEKYECEVAEIKENMVVMRCREARITLKLTQVN